MGMSWKSYTFEYHCADWGSRTTSHGWWQMGFLTVYNLESELVTMIAVIAEFNSSLGLIENTTIKGNMQKWCYDYWFRHVDANIKFKIVATPNLSEMNTLLYRYTFCTTNFWTI